MAKLRKQRNKNHWTLPFCMSGRRYNVHVWQIDESYGKYQVYSGATSYYVNTFEEAAELANKLVFPGVAL